MRVNRMLAEKWNDAGRSAPTGGPRHVLRASRPGPRSLLPGRLRPTSVRAKIIALLMVPVVSLMALWAFATVLTAQNVSDLNRFKQVNATLLEPVSGYVTAVQAERAAAARYLAHPDPARLDALDAKARSTEAAARALRHGISTSSTDAAAISPELGSRTNRLTEASDRLPALRKRITETKTSWKDAYTGYTDTVERGFSVDGALSGAGSLVAGQGRGPEVASQVRVVLELSRAQEMVSREDAIVGSSEADGRMPEERYRSFVGAVQAQQTLFRSAVDDLRPSDEAAYRAVLQGQSYQELRALERTIEDAGPGRATSSSATATWDRVSGSVLEDLHKAQAGASTAAARKADPLSFDVLGGSGIAVVLGLVGVLTSLLISMRIGRGLVVELVEMRNSALELAGSKLPQSLRRLHAGEEVDIDSEAPVQRRGDDEIGQVGSALNAVHRAAIQAAVERAEVLSGISGVYVKLARRSQVLLHRQLDLLDSMERRVEDPTELEDLFRLDHLTTRMRRHAENLIILSGAAPVRGWRRPVPLIDVVRAAVAEVEEFTRVEVRVTEDARIAGSAVADLTHLIAELVENAVAFSPPHTKVQVRGEVVGTGLALEIEDRGLGMSREALTQANQKIVDASQVDLLDTDRLGLFVVNRLAHRRDIQVALQPSVYGGITAVVLIPEKLLEKPDSAQQQDPAAVERDPATVELPVIADRPARRRLHAAKAEPASRQVTRLPAAVPAAEANGVPPAREPVDEPPPDTSAGGGPGPAWPDAAPTAGPPADGARPGSGPAGRGAVHAPGHPAGEPTPLPRRVRQASISPQLRDAPANPPRNVPHIADPEVMGRSPERARATMAALRAGWLSGSGANGTPDPGAEADRPPPPAPDTSRSQTPPQGDEA